MASQILRTAFKLEYFEPKGLFFLKEVSPRFEYDSNNRRTDKVTGYNYHIISQETFNSYTVGVNQTSPLIAADELAKLWEAGERPLVEFKNPTIRAYRSSVTQSYEDSCKAENVFWSDSNQTFNL